MRPLVVLFALLTLQQASPVTVTDPADQPGQHGQPHRADPDLWPSLRSPVGLDAQIEARIDALLERMTLEEKVGQMIQADHSQISPDQVRTYHLGAVLNGGNTVPGGGKHATVEDAVAEADGFWEASVDNRGGRVGIPIIWGTDAVHGHNNMVGATLFPHNIGLGATRNPDLIQQIAKATALEVRASGLDWTFAPTLAVTRDDRWGRTYESYSEHPDVVASYADRAVRGLQGQAGTDAWLGPDRLIASAKHYVADGGTFKGVDQGDARVSEAELAQVHAAGYYPALDAGVQTVMASFSSWNGEKLHGHHYLLTTILKGRLGFDGFVIGDWNGHGQVDGCSNDSCPEAILAGVDMLMAPDSWQPLWHNTLAQVRQGEIPMQRIDDAVRRILRVKLRAGVFDLPRPSARAYAGQQEILGSPGHRAIARQAVRESLVLLKNDHSVLPLRPHQTVMVAGDGADSIAKQSGGWTLSWQGDQNQNTDFPNGQSVFDGLKEVLEAGGGQAVLSQDGAIDQPPDAAVVVFGEDPYAEFQGDLDHVGFETEHAPNLELLRSLKARGIPTVAVFLSGRPLWINPHINAADAFVAAWLPGSEGGGIADVLVGHADGSPRFDFRGRLSFGWPGAAQADPVSPANQFEFGYGLSYASSVLLPKLPEVSGLLDLGAANRPVVLFANGKAGHNLQSHCRPDGSVETVQVDLEGPPLAVSRASHLRQDDALALRWGGQPAEFMLTSDPPINMGGLLVDAAVLEIQLQVSQQHPESRLSVGLGCGSSERVDVLSHLQPSANGDWQTVRIPMSRFAGDGQAFGDLRAFSLSGQGHISVNLSRVSIACRESGNPGAQACATPPAD